MPKALCLLLVLFVALGSVSSATPRELVNVDYKRIIDLYTQLLQLEVRIKVKNVGNRPVTTYLYAQPQNTSKNVAVVLPYEGDTSLQIKKVARVTEPTAVFFEITLANALQPGATTELVIKETHFSRMEPLPRKITLFDDQSVVLRENAQCFSPYETEVCTTTFKLPMTPISYDTVEATARGSVVEYGPFRQLPALSRRFVRLHYVSNTPFVVFKNVTRTVQVSHWGNIAVEDFLRISNEGANLTGEYSRVDYNSWAKNTGKAVLKEAHATLPYSASGVYYLDEIGNISTSNAVRDLSANIVRLRVEPRFHLFGGWSANWVIGYNLPTEDFLRQDVADSEQFVLNVNFGFHFDRIMAEDYTLKVILPEGAKDIQYELPFEIDSVTREKFFYYLDIEGKPVLVFNKKNVLPFHNQVFKVSYRFKQESILIEPFLIFAAFSLFFLLMILLARLNFSFGKEKED
eukprot:TRINITY_DN6585_c0_g2_i2.p1 TRINITY_DN6585_c0_g2~~TRINITY_DN6585_c0_g2_i2.p1  ORF type:complete len:461 (-),score=143.39 TRINITY_DN6585_c0_g2_i2:160-1542(-)